MCGSASRQALQTATKLANVTSEASGAQLWTARVDHVREAQWPDLASLLDGAERAQALRFRVEADRRAYILAHALRRAVLSLAMNVDPEAVQFTSNANGQPLLLAPPAAHPIHFSHSRCRLAVAVAVARSPVGVDVEANDPAAADPELLRRYVAEMGAHSFFTWWTMLEAFWKALGTGLAESNPRICCQPNDDGTIAVALETRPDRALARVTVITSQPDYTLGLALCHPIRSG
jgi:4'-phosphopantetheinyl transferase